MLNEYPSTGGIKIEVSFSPKLYPVYENKNAIVVVVDVLRATSAICTAFEHGARQVIPVETVEEAQEYKKKGYLVGAERDGMIVDGFDFGNSPYSYMGEKIKEQVVVLTTTNGTKAIKMAENAYKVVIGSFVNITALCEWLAFQKRDILFLCSGWKDRYNLEDALFAGAAIDKLSQEYEGFSDLADSALASKYLYQAAAEDPYKFLRNSSHRKRLAKLNLKQDIKYCLTPDQSKEIPILENGVIVKLSSVLTNA